MSLCVDGSKGARCQILTEDALEWGGVATGDETYQEKVVNLFVQFARGDELVQEAMATRVVLRGMLFALDELSHLPSVLLKLLHVVCRLTMCAAAWEALEEADAIGAVCLTHPPNSHLLVRSLVCQALSRHLCVR